MSRSMMMPKFNKNGSFGNVKNLDFDVIVPEVPTNRHKNKPYLLPKSTLKFNYDY